MKNVFKIKTNSSVLEYIFYGNYFYGICTIALSIEAALQQHYQLNPFYYYFLSFLATVLYYIYPYARVNKTGSTNPRTRWYNNHNRFIRWNQIAITSILAVSITWFVVTCNRELTQMPIFQWQLLFIFPIVAAFYYGINMLSVRYNLRSVGWLKPFIIGFTWAGLVTIYPVLFYCITHRLTYEPTFLSYLLFLKNMMFVAVLCIMFDIKDYASDATYNIRTFVVRVGLRKTIFFVLLPLTVLGLLTFLAYALTHQFHTAKILLNTIPFILLFSVGYSLRKRRTLLYYLIIIDGLMLVKAICGSLAMIYF